MKAVNEDIFFKIIKKRFDIEGIEVVRQFTHDKLRGSRRKYVYDVAVPAIKALFEWDGGIWKKVSGHRTAIGVTRDHRKTNQAMLAGWRCFSYTQLNVEDLPNDLEVLIGEKND